MGKLWDEQDGFFYDRLRKRDGSTFTVRARSMVGLLPVFAAVQFDASLWERLPMFRKRARWYIENKPGVKEFLFLPSSHYDSFTPASAKISPLICRPDQAGRQASLAQVAEELERRLLRLFLRDADGRRPALGSDQRFQRDPAWRDLLLFYEYFHGDTGEGLGASHQTGWTALAAALVASRRARLIETLSAFT